MFRCCLRLNIFRNKNKITKNIKQYNTTKNSQQLYDNNFYENNSYDNNKRISELSLENCETYIPPINFAKVIKVYDGDTITIGTLINHNNITKPYKFSLRLYGIDAPEIRTKNIIEKKAGLFVKNELQEMILNKIVLINLEKKPDKYGRLLGTIFLQHNNHIHIDNNSIDDKHYININKWLIDKEYCYEYYGDTKKNIDWNFLVKKYNLINEKEI